MSSITEAGPGAVLSLGARRGTQREYETVVILGPETNKAGVLEFVGRFRAILDGLGSRLIKLDNWGVRTLAYPIRHRAKGVYLYLRYLGGSELVREIERNLRIHESVLRFLTVRVDDDVDPNARPEPVSSQAIEEVAEPGEDPVEVERRRRQEAEAEEARAAAQAAAQAQSEDADEGDSEDGDETDETE